MTPHIKLAAVTALAPAKPDQILIRDLVLDANIGLFAQEKLAAQPVSISITLDIAPLSEDDTHSVSNIVRYDHIITEITQLLAEGHVDLVETLAENIAAHCLAHDRVTQADIMVTKLNAFDHVGGVGVRIIRQNA